MGDECIVCMMETSTFIPNCGHRICRDCAIKWFDRKLSCPMCRKVPVSLPSESKLEPPQTANPTTVVVLEPLDGETPHSMHVGATFGTHAHGVVLIRVHPEDQAYAWGLRKGNIVTHINGIKVKSHLYAAKICDACTERCFPLHFELRPTPPVPSRNVRRWWSCLFPTDS